MKLKVQLADITIIMAEVLIISLPIANVDSFKFTIRR